MISSIYFYAGALAVLLLIFVIIASRYKPQHKKSVQNEYISALHDLLEGNKQNALEKLKHVVRLDTGFIDAYILIGNIFRDSKIYDSAIKVHRDLLVRPSLSIDYQKKILSNLARDYQSAGQKKLALSTCEKLAELDKKDTWNQKFKLKIYEEMGDWQGSFEILKKLHHLDKKEKATRLAAYKVKQGLQLVELKQEHEARLSFREAIKLDSKFYPGYLELINSYIRDKRANDALKELKRFIQNSPEYSDLALTQLEVMLYDAGHFDNIEQFFKQVISVNPKIIQAYIGLASVYEKKGELIKASEMCRKALQQDKKNIKAKLLFIKINHKLQRYELVSQEANQLANEQLINAICFVCSECGFTQKSHFWHCPECGSWNSMKRG